MIAAKMNRTLLIIEYRNCLWVFSALYLQEILLYHLSPSLPSASPTAIAAIGAISCIYENQILGIEMFLNGSATFDSTPDFFPRGPSGSLL